VQDLSQQKGKPRRCLGGPAGLEGLRVVLRATVSLICRLTDSENRQHFSEIEFAQFVLTTRSPHATAAGRDRSRQREQNKLTSSPLADRLFSGLKAERHGKVPGVRKREQTLSSDIFLGLRFCGI